MVATASAIDKLTGLGTMLLYAEEQRVQQMSFSKTLRRLREAAAMSQGELAAKAGVPVDSIQNWEQERSRPRVEALLKLARALGVSADDLIASFDGAGGESKRPRGRPAKPKAEDEPPKKPRGRPRKK